MKAHRAIPDNPSVVFTAMNIGVIALGALIGILIFREKLSMLNKIAILLAVLSILIIAGNEFI
jgi:drug/metabolite transporter (DMT)-like permease